MITETSLKIPKKLTPIMGTIQGTAYQLYNWNGAWIVVGSGRNTKILDEIQRRRKAVEQNMFLVVGPPGKGKSYFALSLAEILDHNFNPTIQVVFSRTQLLTLFGPDTPLKMGQVIIVDEAQFIAGARNWFKDVQKDIMEHLEAVRSRGYIIIIVALHIMVLDKIIRQYVLSHLMAMKKRGQATVYSLYVPTWEDKLYKTTLGHISLQLPDAAKCSFPSCLICKFQNVCMTDRAVYERLKREFLNGMSRESISRNEIRERKRQVLSYPALISKIVSKKDKLSYNSRSKLSDSESIRIMMEDDGIILSAEQAKTVVRRGMISHPEVFKQPIIGEE
jgi:energy-coupling factor transporter ATP-binding protein EcfA2